MAPRWGGVLALAVAFAIALVSPTSAAAAPSAVTRTVSAQAGHRLPPVGQVQPKQLTPQQTGQPSGFQAPPIRAMNPAALQAAKLKAAGSSRPAGNGPGTLFSPNASGIFKGLNQPGLAASDEGSNVTPPDSTGAIGTAWYVEFVNQLVGVYDRTNLARLSLTTLGFFTAAPGGVGTADPQIQWDPQGNRWLYGALGVSPGNNYLLFGWSKTADPSDLVGGWCRFGVATGKYLQDYPKLGHDGNFLILGTNVFDDSQATPPFVTANIWAIAKPAPADASCSSTGPATAFADATHQLKNADGSPAFTPVPANTADVTPTNGYIVAAHDPSITAQSKVMLWHMTPGPSLVADGDISVSSYGVPPSIPQPGVTTTLDSLDGRLTQAVAHFDPGAGAEAIWTQHTVAGSPNSAVRWYEFLPASLIARQIGQLSTSSDFYWNGSISPSIAGDDAAIFYNRDNSMALPVIGAQTRVSNTALGFMDPGEILLGSSSAADQETAFAKNCVPTCRWGDYSGASPDPLNAGVVWGSNQLTGPVNAGRAQWTTQNFAIATGVMINSVMPNGGPTSGGTVVVITGWGFTGATNVSFGAAVPAIFTVNSDSQITATSPPQSPGIVDITIATTRGTSAISGTDKFNYAVPPWCATFDLSGVPTTWVAGQSQTFPVKATNCGNMTWVATGYNEVDLDVHFATSSGGSANMAHWLASQALPLGGNVAPGGSATVSFTMAAPAGSTVVEALMIKEHQFWFDTVTSSPQQWWFLNITVPPTIWSATIDMSQVPTAWAQGVSQTISVKVTNSGNVTWPSTGSNEVDLDLHFTTVAGGSAQQAHWLNSTAFSLPADLAPNASVTLTVPFVSPGNGSLLLEALMIKEHQFWFDQRTNSPQQWSVIAVSVSPAWSATIDMSAAPTTWKAGETKTFTVKVTNNGGATWPSTGYNEVDLDIHLGTGTGGALGSGGWLNSVAYALPTDLLPTASVTLTVTFTSPINSGGSLWLEAEMIKEHQFWFDTVTSSPQQFAPVAVTVSQVTYDLSKAPTTWKVGQTQTFTVTVTNTSAATWISTGYNEVDLDIHFTTMPGGSVVQNNWLTSQAFALPNNVGPGGSVTVSVMVTAPASTGTIYLEAEMIKEHSYWFTQVSSVSVTVS